MTEKIFTFGLAVVSFSPLIVLFREGLKRKKSNSYQKKKSFDQKKREKKNQFIQKTLNLQNENIQVNTTRNQQRLYIKKHVCPCGP